MKNKYYKVMLTSRCVFPELHMVLDSPIYSFTYIKLPKQKYFKKHPMIKVAGYINIFTDSFIPSYMYLCVETPNLSMVDLYLHQFFTEAKTITLKGSPDRIRYYL